MWNAYASLAETENRQAFARTIRSVIDPGGQTVSAMDRLYLAASMPTLIIWGEKDDIIPVSHAHAAHLAIPGSQLVAVIRGRGPLSQIEAPKQLPLLCWTSWTRRNPLVWGQGPPADAQGTIGSIPAVATEAGLPVERRRTECTSAEGGAKGQRYRLSMKWACPEPPTTELQRRTALSRQARPSKRRFHSVMSRSENVETRSMPPVGGAPTARGSLPRRGGFRRPCHRRLMSWPGGQAGLQIDNQLIGAFETALALGCLGWALLDKPRCGVAGPFQQVSAWPGAPVNSFGLWRHRPRPHRQPKACHFSSIRWLWWRSSCFAL